MSNAQTAAWVKTCSCLPLVIKKTQIKSNAHWKGVNYCAKCMVLTLILNIRGLLCFHTVSLPVTSVKVSLNSIGIENLSTVKTE